MEHARIQPSSMDRILACPASVRLSEDLPPRPAGAAATAGHVMHQMFERGMKGESIDPDLVELENLYHSEYSPRRAKQTVEIAMKAANKALSKYSAINVLLETRVPCGAPIGREDFWGTSDIIAFNERTRTLIVADLKTGLIRVSPERSAQMLSYAMGAVHLLGWRPDVIALAIVQPSKYKLEPAIWETDSEYLDQFGQRVAEAISEIEKGGAAS